MSPPSNHPGKALLSENADCSIKIQETQSMSPVLNQLTSSAPASSTSTALAYFLFLFLLLSILLLLVFFSLHSLPPLSLALSLSLCLSAPKLVAGRAVLLLMHCPAAVQQGQTKEKDTPQRKSNALCKNGLPPCFGVLSA